jgi:hypothetical protein
VQRFDMALVGSASSLSVGAEKEKHFYIAKSTLCLKSLSISEVVIRDYDSPNRLLFRLFDSQYSS